MRIAFVLISALLVAGCDAVTGPPPTGASRTDGPSRDTALDTGDPSPTDMRPTDTAPPPPLSYANDVRPILQGACSNCHLGGGQSGSFNFNGGVDDLLVSSGQAAMPIVDPGDHENSYLFHKVDGSHLEVGGTGGRMPLNRQALRNRDINTIAQWIDDGAEP